jgi:hypothetical protein
MRAADSIRNFPTSPACHDVPQATMCTRVNFANSSGVNCRSLK